MNKYEDSNDIFFLRMRSRGYFYSKKPLFTIYNMIEIQCKAMYL